MNPLKKCARAMLFVGAVYSLYAPSLLAAAQPAAESREVEDRLLASLVDRLNTGDMETIRRFVTRHYAPDRVERQVAYWSAVFREVGPLVYYGRDTAAGLPGAVELPFFEGLQTRAWVGLDLRVDPEDEERIVETGVWRGVLPAHLPRSGPLSETELADSLHAYLEASAAGDHFSGVVTVAKDGRVVFEGAYGFQNRAAGDRNTLDTRFALASVTKLFTGVAIAQLVERGIVSYDDPLGKWVLEYPERIGRAVTIRHLLTHTSGIELDEDSAYNDLMRQANSVSDLLAAQLRFASHLSEGDEGGFQPLERFDYSNEGIDLLGVVVERASGESWGDYLREHVFMPAGMSASGTDFLEPVPGLATWYTLRDRDDLGRWTVAERREVRPGDLGAARIRPAGTGYATAGDLIRFFDALERGAILTRESFETITSSHLSLPGPPGRSYGFAFGIEETATGMRSVGHTGAGPGMSTVVQHYAGSGWTVIVLSNYDRAALWVNLYIRRLIGAV